MIHAMFLITKKSQPLKSNPCLTYNCSHSIHKPEARQCIRMILILPRGSDCQEVVLDHIAPNLFRCLQFRTNPWEEEKRKNYKHINSSKLIFPCEFQKFRQHQKPSMLLQRVNSSLCEQAIIDHAIFVHLKHHTKKKRKKKQHEKQIVVTCRT